MGVQRDATQTVAATTARDSLDLATVVKAARALSGEIAHERLLEVVTNIIVENAGARMGAVVLDDASSSRVRAVRDRGAGTSARACESLSETELAPAAALNYVLQPTRFTRGFAQGRAADAIRLSRI
jgi:hypothetical protein